MKLIEDLGMQYATISSSKKVHFGLYECPICTLPFKCRIPSVTSGHTKKCATCAHKINGLNLSVIKNREASNNFIEYCNRIHDNMYDYSLVDYVNAITKVTIICKIHGVFYKTPDTHKRGQGCPSCASSGFDKNKSATMYYLKITDGIIIVYKIGITNRTVQERFNNTDLIKIQILKTWDFPLGVDALAKEQDILKLHHDFKYLGKPILSSGNTELFTKDILGLEIMLLEEP